MMRFSVPRISMVAVFLSLALSVLHARDFRIGYGLVFSLNTLPVSEIDDVFLDMPPGGHSSFFFVETPVWEGFSLAMSPGAMNFENDRSQFHVQYNLLSVNYKLATAFFPVVGAGLGGCIATLTLGSGGYGNVQDGTFLRNSTLIWMANAGIGYRFDNGAEVILEGRALSFLDVLFSKLDSCNIGANLSFRI